MTKQTKNTKLNELCSVFISSCDSYSDLWEPFFTLFNQNWHDCPFNIYLGADKRKYSHNNIKTISSNNKESWSSCFYEHINQIKTPYVIVFLEDFFLREKVNTSKIEDALHTLITLNGHMMRIGRNKIGPARGIIRTVPSYPEYAIIEPDSYARITLQVTIWKKEDLLKLCHKGESIWEFETKGNLRSNIWHTGLYCTWQSIVPYGHHVVERGKWFSHEAKRYSAMNIGCDFTKRKIMNKKEMTCWRLYKCKTYLVSKLPLGLQSFVNKNVAWVLINLKNHLA